MNAILHNVSSLGSHLTLTRVVFEYAKHNRAMTDKENLTLTSVLFELRAVTFNQEADPNLTLTSVLFE